MHDVGVSRGWSQDRPAVVVGALMAAISLGYAIELGNGYDGPPMRKYLCLAMLAPIAGLLVPPQSVWQGRLGACIGPLLTAGMVLQASMLTVFAPGKFLELQSLHQVWALHGCIWALVLLAFCGPVWPMPQNYRRFMMACVATLLGAWVLLHSPRPQIDVFVFARDGGRALLRGENPFSMTFANVYADTQNYHPSLIANNRVLHGFPYPPSNLVVALGDVIAGDARATMVAAWVAAGWLMMAVYPSSRALQAACLFWLTPRCVFLLEQSFFEPLAMFWLTLTAWASRHRPRWVPVTLAWLLMSKQTLPFLAGSAWLLPQLRRPWRGQLRFVAYVVAVCLAAILPFFVCNPAAMVHSLITTHVLQQKAPVSLTLAPYLAQAWGIEPVPLVASFTLLAAITALVCRWAPRTPAGFCFGFGLCYLGFLLLNRQGFANYHHMIIASFCAAAACSEDGASPAPAGAVAAAASTKTKVRP